MDKVIRDWGNIKRFITMNLMVRRVNALALTFNFKQLKMKNKI